VSVEVSGADLAPVTRVPDILDVIAALSSDAVPTPPVLARALLDLLPVEVWSNPDYKWLDPATKSGSILREAARRLMDGLAEWEPDAGKRSEHILKNMLYGCGVTQVHGDMTRRSVYVSKDASGPLSVVHFDDPDGNLPFIQAEHDYPLNKNGEANGPCLICRAPVRLERGDSRENYAYAFIHGAYPTKEMEDMKFDVIVGNPPYQIGMQDDDGNKTANITPLYQMFIDKAIALEPKYVAMIVPSRWFTGGKGLDEFRGRMIKDRRLRSIVDNPKVFDCFPGVKIRGGVNYFLWDRDYDGDCTFSTRIDGTIISTMRRDLRVGDGVLMRDNRAANIVTKVRIETKSTLAEVVKPRDPFGQTLTTNFKGAAAEPFNDSIPLLFGSHIGYVRKDQLERNHALVDQWKVLLPMASSGDTAQDADGRIVDVVLGEPIALAPGSACTQTYLVAGVFDTRKEAENYAHYLATKFVRFLVLQRKSTQHVTPDRFKFVPSVDMKKRWTDDGLYAHFQLSEEEIAYVEASIKPRSVNIALESAEPPSHKPGGAKYRAPGTSEEPEPIEDDE
jgi:site-specific DNA-methyltransferase (adenine-specific)